MKKFSVPVKPKVYVPALFVFLVLLVFMPRAAKFNYDYRKGSEWKNETLVAQFDFPILKTQEQLREEKSRSGSSVIPYYRFADDVVSKNLKAAESLSFGRNSSLKASVIASLNDIYSKGIVSDQGIRAEKSGDALSDDVLYIQKDKRATKRPVTEIYKLTDARMALLSTLAKQYESVNMDSLLKVSGAYDLLAPNLVYDKQTTTLVHSESSRYVSPTSGFVHAGQLIVSNGEIVTGEIEQMLDSYKVEYEHNMGYSGPTIFFWFGNAILALVLVVLLCFSIYFTNKSIFDEFNRYTYLLTIFLLSALGAIAVTKLDSESVYLVPFTLVALYLQAFFKNKVILPMCVISLIPLLVFAQNGIVAFVMYTVAGIVTLQTFKYFNKGWKQFVCAFISFVILTIIWFGFKLADMASGSALTVVAYLFVGSMLSVAFFPLIYLFEKVFNLVSNSRLQELCDTNTKILRELEHTAPGSFQHSLQVMTMADAVARSIDANVLLVRAGALYHDLGKMVNPQCFVENESLVVKEEKDKYHSQITPIESATRIIKHMSDGLEIARREGLPDILCDFIESHHGTTKTAYFYMQYVNEGGDPSNVAPFTYPGKKPVTKEQVILMLCDSIEAASRSLKEHTPEAFSKFVESIVSSKMNEKQFDESDITIKELNTIKDELKIYLGQLYHERVSYPKK